MGFVRPAVSFAAVLAGFFAIVFAVVFAVVFADFLTVVFADDSAALCTVLTCADKARMWSVKNV